MSEARQVVDVLRPERLIEAEGFPHLQHVLGAGVLPGDLHRRIARNQMDE